MDFWKILPLFSPLLIRAVRRSSTRLADTKERLDHWKTYKEHLKADGKELSSDMKATYEKDIATFEDEMLNLSNPRLTFFANVTTLLPCLIGMLLVYAACSQLLASVKIASSDVTPAQFQAFSTNVHYVSFGLQCSLVFFCSFYLKWKIRDVIWRQMQGVRLLSFLRTCNERLYTTAQLAASILLAISTRFFMSAIFTINLGPH